jgi:hypothetical protein
MWEQLGLTVENLGFAPSRGQCIAASLRQLRRSYAADDLIAAWQASGAFSMNLRFLVSDCLRREPAWDSKGRWLEGMDHNFLFREPGGLWASGAMVWGLKSDPCGRTWADPIEVELVLSPDLDALTSYLIRFGDIRKFPEEGLQESLRRIARELEDGGIEWAFIFHGREIHRS